MLVSFWVNTLVHTYKRLRSHNPEVYNFNTAYGLWRIHYAQTRPLHYSVSSTVLITSVTQGEIWEQNYLKCQWLEWETQHTYCTAFRVPMMQSSKEKVTTASGKSPSSVQWRHTAVIYRILQSHSWRFQSSFLPNSAVQLSYGYPLVWNTASEWTRYQQAQGLLQVTRMSLVL